MIWADYALLGLVGLFVLIGLWRGSRLELYSLCVWLLGIVVGFVFCRELAWLLTATVASPVWQLAVAFSSLLALTLGLGSIISYLLGESLARSSFFGHLLGAVVGGLRGLVVVFVIILLAGLTALPTEAWWHEARLIVPFQKLVLRIRYVIPNELARCINYE